MDSRMDKRYIDRTLQRNLRLFFSLSIFGLVLNGTTLD